MPIVITLPRFRQLLNRIFASKSRGTQELQVIDDVFPVVNLVDQGMDELHLPRGEILWSTGGNIPAYGAGRWGCLFVQNTSTLANPYLVVVEHVNVIPAASGIFQGGSIGGSVALTTPFAVYSLDNRNSASTGASPGSPPFPSVGGFNGGAVSAQTGIYRGANNFGSNEMISEAHILGPGMSLQLFDVTVNQSFDCEVQGYTRPMDSAEIF